MRAERVLRCYPTGWRDRYGPELVALLEDTDGDGPLSLGCRVSLVRSGLYERLREAGLVGEAGGPTSGVRGGSLAVLWAWAIFVVAGLGFALAAEDWRGVGGLAEPAGSSAFASVWVAALAGALIVAVGAAVCARPLLVLHQRGGWAALRRPVVRSAWLTAVAVAVGGGLVAWAHQLSRTQRDGGYVPYEILFVVVGLVTASAIASWTATTAAALRRMELPEPVARRGAVLSLALVAVMAVLAAGVAAWWTAMGSQPAWFLGSAPQAPAGPPATPMLVIVAALMAFGLVLAFLGARRVAAGLRQIGSSS